MKNVKHLILTPFNFNFFCPDADSSTDEWMEKRMQIFEDITYSSLMSQTIMDFTWIVGFDPTTPSKWRNKIKKFKGITPVYPVIPKDSSMIWSHIIKEYINKEYLLTTRIDNDDAFAFETVEVLQYLIDDHQPRFINLLQGVITDGKAFYYLDYKSNSFISRLEKSSGSISVRSRDHTTAINTKHFQQFSNMYPLWLVYIHGDNYGWTMENVLKGYLRTHTPTSKDALSSFNVNL